MSGEPLNFDSTPNIDNSIPAVNYADIHHAQDSSSFMIYLIVALVLLVVLWIVKCKKSKNNRT
jgi:hypothetical protein